jgi:hypothetical protein
MMMLVDRRTRRAAAAATATSVLLVLLATATSAATATAAPTTQSLSAGPWKLANANGTLTYTDVSVPAYPHQVLQSKGVIDDPLYRYNELATRWVCDDRWTFSRDFDVTAAQAASAGADLVFKGLDTFASVTLNGELILRADNFHRTWRVPVGGGGLLKPGKNTLVIELEPAEATAVRLKAEMPYTVNALHQPGGMDIYNYARKGAYSFGWGELALFFGGGKRGKEIASSRLFFFPRAREETRALKRPRTRKKTDDPPPPPHPINLFLQHTPPQQPRLPTPTNQPNKQKQQTGAPPSPSAACTARSTLSRTPTPCSRARTWSRRL